ncbi:MAG: hypothetical protein R3C44_08365 [Chloroflexota bacterium]
MNAGLVFHGADVPETSGENQVCMTTPSTQRSTPPPPETGSEAPPRMRLLLWGILGLLVVAGLIAAGWMVYMSLHQGRPLYPSFPTAVPAPSVSNSVPEEITFAALNENPANYMNRLIQATGDYTLLDLPNCRPYAGPQIEWSLVADNLQLNAVGYENILRLAEPGMAMTVVGVWQLYSGPVGCGKEPPDGVVWYLDVVKIVEPNPLLGGSGSGPQVTFVPGEPTVPVQTVQPIQPTMTIAVTDGITDTVNSSPTPTLDITTPLPGNTPTGEPTTLPLTPLATPGTPETPLPTEEGTPPPDATLTATIDPNATPTEASGETATPGLPTNTPPSGGYPEPSPSPTTGGYP